MRIILVIVLILIGVIAGFYFSGGMAFLNREPDIDKSKRLEIDLKKEETRETFAKIELAKAESRGRERETVLQIQRLSLTSDFEDKRHSNRIETFSVMAVIAGGFSLFFLFVVTLLFFFNANQERVRHYRVMELNTLHAGDRHFDQKRIT